MRTAIRTVLLALSLTLLVSGMTLSATPSSQVPTLGLRVSSEIVATDASPTLLLSSRTDSPSRVAFSLPPGWNLGRESVTLEPWESLALPFQEVGPEGEMTSTQSLTALGPSTGAQGRLEIATRLLSERPTPPRDWTPWAMTLGLALALILAAALGLRWLRSNVQVTRRR